MRMDISEAVRHWGTYYGDNIALLGQFNISYKKLNNCINNISVIINKKIGCNKTIAILTDNGFPFIVFLIAIIRTNNKFILLNPNLADKQVNNIINLSNCSAAITCENNCHINITQIDITLEELFNYKLIDEFYPEHYYGTNDVIGTLFTSGTTGQPKGLERTNYSILSEAILWIVELGLTKKSSMLIPRVLYNTSGFVLMYSTLFIGGRIDLFNNPTTEDILKYLQMQECEWTFLVPSVLREILAYYTNYIKISQNVLVMGEPISSNEKLAFANKFKCNIIEAWGNSEGLGTITEAKDLYINPNSVGRPFFTDRIEIIDDNMCYLPSEESGTICGYSDNEFKEYLKNDSLTKAIKQNHLIISSDVGKKDKNGYLYVFARNDDVIMVDGLNVYPKDIEDVLRQTNKVKDCIVVGLTNEIKNSKPIAIVEKLDKNFNTEDLLGEVNSQLAPYEHLYKIIEIDKLPRNEGGKIVRTKIMEIIMENDIKDEYNHER